MANKIPNELGNMRRSMVVLMSGPGSIVDFRADGAPVSAVVAGLEEWDKYFSVNGQENEQKVYEPRLQRKLGVYGFRLPPVIDELFRDDEGRPDPRSLIAVRFPKWLVCPQCNLLAPDNQWASDPGKAYRYCPQCTANSPGQQRIPVIPVRFVMACEAGHLDEFPWNFWVHHQLKCDNRTKFYLNSEGPGLSGLIVRCPKCGASQSMDGIFSEKTWSRRKYRCKGKQPWLRADSEGCDLLPRVLQRGASNMYFPVLVSALSIPPYSDRLQEVIGKYWGTLVGIPDPKDREKFIGYIEPEINPLLEELKISPKELSGLIEQRISRYNEDASLNIRQEEFRTFVEGVDIDTEEEHEFEIRNVQIPATLRHYFSHIVRAVRLREVTALKGFTRINPPGDEDNKNIAPIQIRKLNWLPAIEVKGEGIFLSLDPTRFQEWEKQKEVQERATDIQNGWKEEWDERFDSSPTSPIVTARYLLVHTFAHALIRQLSLECGYSSASLRERLYVGEDDDMAGLLIYTATSDSDGTLGGLQRQGLPGRISRTICDAVHAMEWCSSDPLCINRGRESHSFAACHSCCFTPETSCEQHNRFLDRAMLVGLPDNQEIGFFYPMLQVGI